MNLKSEKKEKILGITQVSHICLHFSKNDSFFFSEIKKNAHVLQSFIERDIFLDARMEKYKHSFSLQDFPAKTEKKKKNILDNKE